jgi:predicted dehydrogenase
MSLSRVAIGMVGAGLMGQTHSLAYHTALRRYADGRLDVHLSRVSDVDVEAAHRTAQQFGWAHAGGDWREVTRAPDVDLVDIATPNHLHQEIAVDAARHGKGVLCEKPLARSAAEAAGMHAAVEEAQVIHQTGFVLRHWPVVALAKRLIDEGRLGRLLTFRASYLQDLALDPKVPLSWRFQRALAGAGSLGDIGSHVIDLALLLVGPLRRVFARSETIWDQRPRGPHPAGRVDVDDMTDMLVDFEDGAKGVISTSWVAAGHKMDLRVEIAGTDGSVSFGLQRPNALEVALPAAEAVVTGSRTVLLGPEHVDSPSLVPTGGYPIGLSDLYAAQAWAVIRNVAQGVSSPPTFLDGLRVAEVVDAATRAHESGGWVSMRAEA